MIAKKPRRRPSSPVRSTVRAMLTGTISADECRRQLQRPAERDRRRAMRAVRAKVVDYTQDEIALLRAYRDLPGNERQQLRLRD